MQQYYACMICDKEDHLKYQKRVWKMKSPESLWKETKQHFDRLERSLIDCYINFLREVAKSYLKEKRRVFFRENQIVHWGEWNFGCLIIEGNEYVGEVFGDYISEIRFEPNISNKVKEEYIEIKEENVGDIRYKIIHYANGVKLPA
ncbi:MAG: hypothetical protein SV062_01935 [Thermodesulfobacteriota bacterium]|nr:hypothetical protein [Thermodesulfobacteriota bacterium]